MSRLKDKVAIVTGASRGIGFSIARRLASEGATVVVADRIGAGDAAGALAEEGLDVVGAECDISRRDEVRKLFDGTVERFGHLTILVNNAALAGHAVVAPLIETGEELWRAILDTNLSGTFYCSQAAARHMISGGNGGRIVNITSIGGIKAEQNAGAYCATKAAVESLTRSLAIELAPHSVSVNSVAPGDIRVDGTSRVAHSDIQPRQVVGRLGHPDDVASAVAYLVTDEASFITGTSVVVDGGVLASSWLAPRR